MELKMNYEDGQTPIDEDEKRGLKIKSISTLSDLDAFEQQNIEDAMEWVHSRSFEPGEVLDITFILDVHKRMFKNVWKWAGQIRQSNKNIGVHYYEIRQHLRELIDDCTYWIEHKTYPPEEIALRFKHRLVSIHLFPNGNGRHSRLMGDIILKSLDKAQSFSWGSKSLRQGESRGTYLAALKKADAGEIEPLMEFSMQ
jgi:Fic-DOC domain mobile mystery protein B